MRASRRVLTVLSLLLALPTAVAAGELQVVGTQPAARSLGAPLHGAIAVTFDRAVQASTVTPARFWAFARWSGTVSGSFSFSADGRTVTLTPDAAFSAGESVLVLLSDAIQAQDGSPLRTGGYSFQFWVAAGPAGLELSEADRLTTRTTPGQSSRAYGGFAGDLDEDGWLDLTIVNEDTEDLRVFPNRADGSGLYDDFLQPPNDTGGATPSPSETGDFDHDGHTDVAVANTVGLSVAILLGNGDGTFAPPQVIALPQSARGVAVLDLDGDADLDVAATQLADSDLVLLFNNGSGVFGSPTPVGSGAGSPWALGAGDFDEDGLLDLVVGTQSGQRAKVYLGMGNGTVTPASDQPIGGNAWMIAVGDVDGDGHDDVSSANGSSNEGAILLGDGAGHLGAPDEYPVDPQALATDLGDLDGDGDLDWITASYFGDWSLFTNDGDGTFTFDREIASTEAASCSVMLDMDRDGDLDLALIDELEDEVILLHNTGGLFADGFESGDTAAWSTTVP
ncbi:MAG: FG-GAP-like repeat-containing protein [Thermoanaerobaculia bacterium]